VMGTATDAPFHQLSFLQSAAFQFSNPKAWAFSFATVTTFAAQSAARLVAVILIWSVAILLGVGLWAAMGHALKGLMARPAHRRVFNVSVALLLAATAIAGAWSQLPGAAGAAMP